jgi:mono/diheme cytochrome c family protein
VTRGGRAATRALTCIGIGWLASTGLVLHATRTASERHEHAPGGQETKATSRRTVWDGVYTEAQAARGRMQYMQACSSCHASDLRGDSTAPSLIEESFSFQWGDATVGELLERIQKLMPSDRPNSLSSQTYRNIVAFILQSNRFPPGEKELDSDADALGQIVITITRPGGQG